jgi:ketosteroid isomerase-like protein
MNRLVPLLIVVCLCTVGALSQTPMAESPRADAGGDAATIRQIEDQWLNAERTTNTVVLEKTLADDFVGIGTNGLTPGKEQLLKNWQPHAGQTPSYSVEISNMQIIVRGETAVAAYTKTYTAKENGNVAHEDKTDVFMKDHTEWKLKVSRASFR